MKEMEESGEGGYMTKLLTASNTEEQNLHLLLSKPATDFPTSLVLT